MAMIGSQHGSKMAVTDLKKNKKETNKHTQERKGNNSKYPIQNMFPHFQDLMTKWDVSKNLKVEALPGVERLTLIVTLI